MEISKVIPQKVNAVSVLGWYFLFFLVLSILFLLSGANSVTWGFKPPLPPQETPSEPSDTEVSLPEQLILEPPPKSWGFPIKGSSGRIFYNKEYHETFLIKIKLEGLSPNHRYVLTLNGKIWHESNERLPQGRGKEKYYDFAEIFTNGEGNVQKYESLDLSLGKYNVKFFVKDPANKWKIVLYNDLLIFTAR